MSERTMSRFLMVGNAHLSFTLPCPSTSGKKKRRVTGLTAVFDMQNPS